MSKGQGLGSTRASFRSRSPHPWAAVTYSNLPIPSVVAGNRCRLCRAMERSSSSPTHHPTRSNASIAFVSSNCIDAEFTFQSFVVAGTAPLTSGAAFPRMRYRL